MWASHRFLMPDAPDGLNQGEWVNGLTEVLAEAGLGRALLVVGLFGGAA